jgi:hypothetical protein
VVEAGLAGLAVTILLPREGRLEIAGRAFDAAAGAAIERHLLGREPDAASLSERLALHQALEQPAGAAELPDGLLAPLVGLAGRAIAQAGCGPVGGFVLAGPFASARHGLAALLSGPVRDGVDPLRAAAIGAAIQAEAFE